MFQPFIDKLEGLLVFEDLEQLHGMAPTGVKVTHLSHYILHGLGVLGEVLWPWGIPEPWLRLFSGCRGPHELAGPAHRVDTVSLQHGPAEARKNLLLQTPTWRTDLPCGLWAAMQVVSPISCLAWICSCFCGLAPSM